MTSNKEIIDRIESTAKTGAGFTLASSVVIGVIFICLYLIFYYTIYYGDEMKSNEEIIREASEEIQNNNPKHRGLSTNWTEYVEFVNKRNELIAQKSREEGIKEGREAMFNELQDSLDNVKLRCKHCKRIIDSNSIEYEILIENIFSLESSKNPDCGIKGRDD